MLVNWMEQKDWTKMISDHPVFRSLTKLGRHSIPLFEKVVKVRFHRVCFFILSHNLLAVYSEGLNTILMCLHGLDFYLKSWRVRYSWTLNQERIASITQISNASYKMNKKLKSRTVLMQMSITNFDIIIKRYVDIYDHNKSTRAMGILSTPLYGCQRSDRLHTFTASSI